MIVTNCTFFSFWVVYLILHQIKSAIFISQFVPPSDNLAVREISYRTINIPHMLKRVSIPLKYKGIFRSLVQVPEVRKNNTRCCIYRFDKLFINFMQREDCTICFTCLKNKWFVTNAFTRSPTSYENGCLSYVKSFRTYIIPKYNVYTVFMTVFIQTE